MLCQKQNKDTKTLLTKLTRDISLKPNRFMNRSPIKISLMEKGAYFAINKSCYQVLNQRINI